MPAKDDTVLRPDLCVIGASAAGLSIASAGALLGVSVALVVTGEQDAADTGLKTAALIASANRAHAIRTASKVGIGAQEPAIDFAGVRKHMSDVVAAQAAMTSLDRYRAMGAQVFEGAARFQDSGTVVAGGRTIKARRFIVATCSRPAVPEIPGLNAVPYLTEKTIFDLTEVPPHLIILGAGANGVEFAQAYRRLGAQVMLVTSESRILPEEDPELSSVVERSLRHEGVEVRLGEKVEQIGTEESGGITALLGEHPIMGSHVLVSCGRIPAIEELGLGAGKIREAAGGIVVNRRMRSSNSRVYAVGHATGQLLHGEHFAQAATRQAGIAFRHAVLNLPVSFEPAKVPRIVRSDPEFASIGLTELEARARSLKILVLRSAFADNDLALAEGTRRGHLKAIVTPRGRLLGCSIVGPRAGDLIMPWALAMARDLKVSELADLSYPHPGYSETTKACAVEFVKLSAQNPWLRRLVGLVRRWG